MTALQRELPLALVKCCDVAHLVSMLHPIPPCPTCAETPEYRGETDWAIAFEEWFPGDL